ncbi:zinc iron ABC transporter, ATP-binding protein [Lactobacillus selangorensis]|uniref:Zinc iron ABC transporter, ATP-binding protein n=2 Tax=Lactobacillus selangorensis TaxID=81857 RepID=A0A0R2FS31_9LACO|nr:zinc iron ABC transporter, ATP-binding protein [Lactobacillus selangorensis]KRN30178.1 zinc iron ABC transporter, ATP-binding protein [Lactobacillus selangorensis]
MNEMTTKPLLKITDLSIAFRDRKLIQHLNLTVQPGEFLAIIGENGVGKTTLIRTVTGQRKPEGGTIQFDVPAKKMRFGYVPQFRNISEEYPLSMRDFVELNLLHLRPWLTKKEHQRVTNVLTEVGIENIDNTSMGQASGGEKQKAYLAQAIVNEPRLLILDESTASLDVEAKNELMGLVKKLNQQDGLTVLFITHDLPLAKKYADQFLLIRRNGQYEEKPIDQLDTTQDIQ